MIVLVLHMRESTYSQLAVMASHGLELFSDGSNQLPGLQYKVTSFVVKNQHKGFWYKVDGGGCVNIDIK